jgi:hypothetical protein
VLRIKDNGRPQSRSRPFPLCLSLAIWDEAGTNWGQTGRTPISLLSLEIDEANCINS